MIMREILFRGKTKDSKWVEGFYYVARYRYAGGKEFISEKHMITTGIVEASGGYGESVETIEYSVIPESVSEFTGLTDKNGEKIFEGDIVNCDGVFCVVRYGKHQIDCCGCCYHSHSSVGFYLERDGDCQKAIISDYDTWDDLYIIGNIHDNPELLKGGAE
jgi:uncharacterized phage protein (TIGR01671 family)